MTERLPLTVVVPVFHEEATIAATLAELRRTIRTPHTVLVVYDYAEDPTVPVVFMTAQASLQSAIQAVNLGATHYVQKPFSNEELLAILRSSLDIGQTRRENVRLKKEIRTRDRKELIQPIGVSPCPTSTVASNAAATGSTVEATAARPASTRSSAS